MKVYKFKINDHEVYPIYDDKLGIDHSIKSDQMFMRKSLAGKFSLVGADFDWLYPQSINTDFILTIERLIGTTWEIKYTAKFTKFDCSFDVDNKSASFKSLYFDKYDNILNKLDKEYDVLALLPKVEYVNYFTRPILQAYVLGSSVLTNYRAGSYFDQDATVIDSESDLTTIYKFGLNNTFLEFIITGPDAHPVCGIYASVYAGAVTDNIYMNNNGLFYITFTESIYGDTYSIKRVSDDVLVYLWGGPGFFLGTDTTLYPAVPEYTDLLTIWGKKINIYARLIAAKDIVGSSPIPLNDIVSTNHNYKYCMPFTTPMCKISADYATTANEYGRNDVRGYFIPPLNDTTNTLYPLCKPAWINASLWFNMTSAIATDFDVTGRTTETLKDAYLLHDLITKILADIDSTLVFTNTEDHSEFLYGSLNPITGQVFELLITPKTNVFRSTYDRAAQNAKITLGQILELLRVAYKCHWHLEGNNFRIEHVSWYRNGRSYSGTPAVCLDLTVLLDAKNRKPYAFGQSKISYDKSAIPSKMTFKWMDTVSQGFEGYPIEVLDNYAKDNLVEPYTISKFTSDIDQVIANYENMSKDGFMIFACVNAGTTPLPLYSLPMVSRTIDDTTVLLQNGYLSWLTLHPNYHVYDAPGATLKINGTTTAAETVQRNVLQSIVCPSSGLNTMELIKTFIGFGYIDKFLLTLSSLSADITLRHDTE